jgi:hypothetical protein
MSVLSSSTFALKPGVQNEGRARSFLTDYHWPVPMQDAFLENLLKIPLHFFICDDSSSMGRQDGKRLIKKDKDCFG